MTKISICRNALDNNPIEIELSVALRRIKTGERSKDKILAIRQCLNAEKKKALKETLPSVLFAGTFKAPRKNQDLLQHSGFMILDFDHIGNILEADFSAKMEEFKNKMKELPYVYAVWVSPSGDGVKVLVKIADGSKHIQHFHALQDEIKGIDRSGVNVARFCFESYDPEIYINENAVPFNKIKKLEQIVVKQVEHMESNEAFKKLVTWITEKKNAAFQSGERNIFVFKLASACCRFGIDKFDTENLIQSHFPIGNDFSSSEMRAAVSSAYRSNTFGSAMFEKDKLIDVVSRQEVNAITFVPVEDQNFRVRDTIYGFDVRDNAIRLNEEGFKNVVGINNADLDRSFKPKRGDLTLLTGIGNYGKSSFKKWYFLMRIILYGEKVATFSPEDSPPEEYFHDYVEMLLGCECTPNNPNRPSKEVYQKAYDFISDKIFYINPDVLAPTPALIKERFLELVIQEKVSFVCIDPFNQLSNDYSSAGGRSDKYLETFLSDCSRWAKSNDVYFWIIAHPKSMQKIKEGTLKGNYPCPDVYDIADGAMWNNKVDNILVYHRPFAQTMEQNPDVEFHAKKIKRKAVGKRGTFVIMNYVYSKRRFTINGVDPMQQALEATGIKFRPSLDEFDNKQSKPSSIKPNIEFNPISTPRALREEKPFPDPDF
jgi:hypothetical protein